MAAGKLEMLLPIKVLAVPSAWTPTFINSLAAEAAGNGKTVGYRASWSFEDVIDDCDMLVVQGFSDDNLPPDASDWFIVLPPGPADTLAALCHSHPEIPRKEAVRAISRLYGCIDLLVARGAKVSILTSPIQIGDVGPIDVQDAAPTQAHDPVSGLEPFEPADGVSRAITWGPDVFSITHSQGTDGGPREIALLGRGRILVHGPYITLPNGIWRARFDFELDPEDVDILLRFDWGQANTHASFVTEITKAGTYTVDLIAEISGLDGVEFRAWTCRGTLHGRIMIGDLTIERLSDGSQALHQAGVVEPGFSG